MTRSVSHQVLSTAPPATRGLVVLLVAAALLVGVSSAAPMGTAFTYQGQLSDAGLPATGAYDLQFKLFDAAAAGAQIGSTVLKGDVAVSGGQFMVSLDFGATPFAGQARFLEIGVRPGASSGAYTTLGSRHELTPSPNATFAAKAADATTVAGLACTNNQVAKWSGTTWTCGTDSSSGGTVTSVTAGSGLSGGAITSSGTIAVAPLGITSSMIANGAVGSAQVNTAQVQQRIGGACPPGLTIQTVNPDGSVVCRTATAHAGFSLATIDASDGTGYESSIAIGLDGLGLIAYIDGSGFFLRVAHCSNPGCTVATTTTLTPLGMASVTQTSIAIGTDGLGLISFHGDSSLRVAHCSNAACTSASIATIDTGGVVGLDSSLTIGADGLGLISYRDVTNGALKVAHCSNTPCSSATKVAIETGGGAGYSTSITIGGDQLGLISYHLGLSAHLKTAHCANTVCSSASTSTIDGGANVGLHNSIVTGSDGFGLIAYLDNSSNRLKTAHCSNAACTSATLSTVDAGADTGFYPSIAIGPDGLGLITYTNFDSLRVAHCSNAFCSTAVLSTLDTPYHPDLLPSIAIGPDGLGLISYMVTSPYNLKTAHCPNIECRPAVTTVDAGPGLVTDGTSGGSSSLSVQFGGSGSATSVARSDHNHDSTYWKLGGNSGTVAGTNFLGTIGGQTLELRASAVGINKSNPGTALDVFGTGTMTGLTVNGASTFNGAANFNGALQVTRTLAQATVFDGTSNHTGGSWLSIRNTGGGKSWNLISTGPTNGEGAGKFLLRSESDSSVVMTLDGATAPWVGIGTSTRTVNRQIETSSGAFLTTGGVWTNSSDRNLKENLLPVAGYDVLARLAKLPVYRWNYRNEPDSLTHIGPTAQDFEAAFGLGGDGRSISTIDPSGIALAAIQELNRKTEALGETRGEIARLKEQVAALAAALERLTSQNARDVKDRR